MLFKTSQTTNDFAALHLGEAGCLHLANDLDYNNVTFASAWNAAHPEQDPIQYDAGFSI